MVVNDNHWRVQRSSKSGLEDIVSPKIMYVVPSNPSICALCWVSWVVIVSSWSNKIIIIAYLRFNGNQWLKTYLPVSRPWTRLIVFVKPGHLTGKATETQAVLNRQLLKVRSEAVCMSMTSFFTFTSESPLAIRQPTTLRDQNKIPTIRTRRNENQRVWLDE